MLRVELKRIDEFVTPNLEHVLFTLFPRALLSVSSLDILFLFVISALNPRSLLFLWITALPLP